MIVTLKWLKEFLPELKLDAEALATELSLIGHESVVIDHSSIDVDVTANRGDACSIYGLARDLSGSTGLKLSKLSTDEKIETDLSFKVSIDKKVHDSVYHYHLYKIENVDSLKLNQSITEKLKVLGLQTKNPIIDLTNILSHELGLPMHAFDADKIKNGLVIRESVKNEVVTLINDRTINLETGILVQESEDRIVDLVGVMGAKNSAVSNRTKTVILQVAVFSPTKVRFNSQSTGIKSPASWRFERGVDPLILNRAINRFTSYFDPNALEVKLVFKTLIEKKEINIKVDRKKVELLIGSKIDKLDYEKIERIGIELSKDTATIPSWRYDISNWQDIAEEVIRLNKLELLTEKKLTKQTVSNNEYESLFSLKKQLTSIGFSEILTLSFSKVNSPIEVTNFPVAPFLRSSLSQGMLQSIAKNPFMNRLKFFEVGNVFKPAEVKNIGFAVVGFKQKDVNEIQEKILSETGLRVAFVSVDEKELKTADVKQTKVFLAEVNLPKHSTMANDRKTKIADFKPLPAYSQVSKYPPIVRDISLLLSKEVGTDEIINYFTELPNCLIVELVDTFGSESIGIGNRVDTYRLIFQDVKTTLNSDEVTEIVNQGLRKLSKNVQFQLR